MLGCAVRGSCTAGAQCAMFEAILFAESKLDRHLQIHCCQIIALHIHHLCTA